MKTHSTITIEIDRDKKREIADKEINKQPISAWFVVSVVAFTMVFAVLVVMALVG